MSKFGDILNKDVGSLATKVLKADVGVMVKGAGRALNTDVGTIAKGAGKVFTYDLGELFSGNGSQPKPEPKSSIASGALEDSALAATPATSLSAAAPHDDAGGPSRASATIGMVPAPGSTGAFIPVNSATGPATTEPPKARLTEALVNRQCLAEPSGADLLLLLPLQIGNFERAKGVAHGDIASDPVNVTYSGSGEVVSVTLVSCWDADEALEKLERSRVKLENSRSSKELSWVAGIDTRGVVFLWVRSSFCFEVVSPRGVSPIARFLGNFPY